MSFRNTFTTSFIYQASVETAGANVEITAIFERWCGSTLSSRVNERGYGCYAGYFKSLSGEREALEDVQSIVRELEKVTRVPFELSVLIESGPAVTYSIRPATTNQ